MLFMLDGAAQAIVGGAVFVQVEVPVAAQVVGGIAVVHGMSDIEAGFRQVVTGHRERSVIEQGVSQAAQGLGASPQTAQSLGTGVDLGLGLISPVPGTGAPGAAVAVSRGSSAAVMSVEAARAAEAARLAQAARPVQLGTHVMMAATALGPKGSGNWGHSSVCKKLYVSDFAGLR